jgi:hypothetical protein
VAGGQLLQLLLDTQEYAAGARGKRPSWGEVGREHSRPGSGIERSPLVGRGAVELFGATGRDTQVARAATEMASGGSTCSLTTVQWGTTAIRGADLYPINQKLTKLLEACLMAELGFEDEKIRRAITGLP